MERARRVVWIGIFLTVVVAAGFYFIAGPGSFAGPYQRVEDEALRHSQEAYDQHVAANNRLVDAWLDHQVFSWKWWVNTGLTVFPWVFWFFIRRKESTHRLLYGALVMIFLASYMDYLGVTYGFWRYHVEVVPSIPSYIPWDFALYPVAWMLYFQFYPGLSPYLKALLFACVAALVVEPCFICLKFYEPVNWHTVYSLPIHFLNYLIGHWFASRTEFRPIDPKAAIPPWSPPQPHRPE